MGADRGRGRVQHVDLVALDNRPPAVLIRKVGDAFVNDPGRPVTQRRVDDVAVPGHPADIRSAPVNRVGLDVEDVVVGRRSADQVPGRRVDDTLRFRGGPTRVEQVKQVLRVHLLARTGLRIGTRVFGQVLPPDIASVLHRRVARRATQHHRLLDRGSLVERGIRVLLQRHRVALAQALVLGDQQLALHVIEPARQGVGAETAEDDRVGGTQPGAGEHCHRQLGHHAHVDSDRGTLLDSELLQRVGKANDLGLQVLEGDGALLINRFAFPVIGDLIAASGLDVAVDAVVAHVQLAAEEPLGIGQLPFEDSVEGLEPGDPLLRLFSPEVLERLVVDVGLGVRILRKLGGRRVASLFQLHRLDGMRAGLDRHRLIQPPSKEWRTLVPTQITAPPAGTLTRAGPEIGRRIIDTALFASAKW